MNSPAQALGQARRRYPLLDHVIRMQDHYGSVNASQQAGAITYFAFLSFFPILALAVFVVGYVSHVYPDANANLTSAINSVLPKLVGNSPGQISLSDVRGFTGLAGIVGLLGVVYSGLGWISALRTALVAVFELPPDDRLGFIPGKLRDLLTLMVIGLVLVLAVAVAGFVGGFSDTVLGWLGLGDELGWLVKVLSVVLGLAANMLLFFAMFRLLAEPRVPTPSLWSGALLGAVGFEVLKQVSAVLFGLTSGQPAFQAFGIALILVVWINYFSRVVLYAASWAYVSPAARELRAGDAEGAPVQGPSTPALDELLVVSDPDDGEATPDRSWVTPFAAGAASMLGVVAVVRRRR